MPSPPSVVGANSRGEPSEPDAHPDAPWWRSTWPLGTCEYAQLGIAFIAIVALFTAVGFALTEAFDPNPLTDLDARLARSLATSRTDTRTDLARWGAFPANTGTKIIVSALLVIAALARWRRWHEGLLISLSLIFEASAFVVISHLVGRPRPDVERLLESPLDTSFPSGHVAAATVYLALAIIVARHSRSTLAPTIAVAVGICVAGAVATSRMYQGMHYLTDVLGGAALGLVSLAVVTRVITNSRRAPLADSAGAVTRQPRVHGEDF